MHPGQKRVETVVSSSSHPSFCHPSSQLLLRLFTAISTTPCQADLSWASSCQSCSRPHHQVSLCQVIPATFLPPHRSGSSNRSTDQQLLGNPGDRHPGDVTKEVEATCREQRGESLLVCQFTDNGVVLHVPDRNAQDDAQAALDETLQPMDLGLQQNNTLCAIE